ncbi:MAG: flagellar motor switch protein FliG, partial [Spirochaetaceae bacterium]|nr:flagellar motor switch protein FliG [Spirochaetaceae bacterium]
GGDEAAKILSSLEPDQIEAISGEIASIRGITGEEAELIFEEFRSLLTASYGYGGASTGGPEAARRLLYAAFGPEKGEAFLQKAIPRLKDNPFDFLANFSGEQTGLLLREESPAAAALILSRLPAQQSAAVLAAIPPDRKLEIVRRIAHQGQISPEVLTRVAAALREKARMISQAGAPAGDAPGLDGRNVLAAILKHSDLSFGDRLLNELDEADPDLSRDLKERIYTLEDVIRAEDKPIQEKLRTMEDRDIVLLLKSRSEGFAEKILSNISAGRRESIREEGELIGSVPKREVDEAARNFLAWFRQGREEGRILLLDEDIFV